MTKDPTLNPFSKDYKSQLTPERGHHVPNNPLKQYPTNVFANIAPPPVPGKRQGMRRAKI